VKLGRYEVLRRIAKGGMAELFLARQVGAAGIEKLVVCKRILPELAGDAEFVRMFLDEARLAAGLHHSNVVQVYDIGEAEDGYFFAMEYLHGEDLRHVMRALEPERMPLEHALSIALGVCAGLHYAHERAGSDGKPLGIVHRDVSPHNVFLTWDGGVKVLDFGIAKAARRLSETRTGALKGKIQYLSPEQCNADPVDRRSDVFAIGILLWELTVGRRLYSGKSDLVIMKAITERAAPRPSELVHDYPAGLEAVVMQALERRPAQRFQTAEALQLALEDWARARRLALSPVGLSRWLKVRFGGEAAAWETAQRGGTDAMTTYAASRLERRPDEDEVVVEPSRPHTRPVDNRRPPPRRRWWALGGAVVLSVAAVVAGLSHAPPPTAPPPPPAPVVNIDPPAAAPPPPIALPPPPPVATAAAPPKPRPIKRTRAHRRHHVDLDAPLPPK
jgi:eukaryotic-like serine/threonine-protein kinase